MKIFYSLLCFSLLALCLSCQSNTPSDSTAADTAVPTEIKDGPTPKEAFAKLLKDTPNPQLVDVRTPQEYSEGIINGAVNYNFHDGNFLNHLTAMDKTQPVFIYCQSGGRSGKAYKMMKEMGFAEVYDLEGGYGAWE